MSASTVANFFAVLLLGGAGGLLAVLVRRNQRQQLADSAAALAALVAVGAMFGSLYFSEIAGFVPCELCWFQRIAMYPLAIILTMALVRRVTDVLPYAIALAGIGLSISLYHIQLQLFPDQGSFCDIANPCTLNPVEALGWMTIPQMAAVSFAMIVVLSTIALRYQTEETA